MAIIATITQVPLKTRVGIIWTMPIKPPSAAKIAAERNKSAGRKKLRCTVCDFCARQERCREAVAAGNFIGCEWPLEKELVRDVQD